MEQQEPRKLYINNLIVFLKQEVRITDNFMKELENHSNKQYITEVNKLETDMEKKIFIFLEFTRGRRTCNEMVLILEKCGQKRAAMLLNAYNTSPEFRDYTNDIQLTVTPTLEPKSGESKWFIMDGTPKGVCFIINNVKNVLEKESYRFKNVFEQIDFNVFEMFDLTAQEIAYFLYMLSNEERLKNDNALIVMIISHGRDETIVCKASNENEMESLIEIETVVEYFSDTNCANLANKPKLFFFNCCRTKTNNGQFMSTKTRGTDWKNNNKYTMLCYACSEGRESWYIPGEYTHFGQELSHCIAQHACDQSVQYILNHTAERMRPYVDVEIRPYTSDRDLFLNPGVKKFSFN